MRFIVIAAALLATPAAADCIIGAEPPALTITALDIAQAAAGNARVRVAYRAERSIRMVDGHIEFRDALGADLGSRRIPRDRQTDAGATAYVTDLWTGRGAAIDPDDVRAALCVRGIVFDDGTVWRPQ